MDKAQLENFVIEIVRRIGGEPGFKVLPRRWVVERTFAWMLHYRRRLCCQTAPHHRDPFDRLLIAQAVTEPAIFYTADPQLEAYSELVIAFKRS